MVVPIDLAPTVFGCGRFSHPAQHFRENHRNHTFMVTLFSYVAMVRIGDDDFSIQPGDVVLFPAHADIRYHFPRPGSHWCLRLLPGIPDPSGGTVRLPVLCRLDLHRFEAQRRLNAITQDWMAASGDQRHAFMYAARTGAASFITWLAGVMQDQAGAAGSIQSLTRMQRATVQAAEILRHPESHDLAMTEVARRCSVSHNRLTAAFRLRYGESMIAYRNRCTIDRARWLFDTTRLTISEVRTHVGVPDPHHFNKLFRRVVGAAPARYCQQGRPLVNSTVSSGLPTNSGTVQPS
jgi:AraC-like DNA-binding protein